MKLTRRAVSLGLIALGFAPGRASAAEDEITFDQVSSKWTVAADGTWVVDAEVTIRAPKVNASHVVRVPLSWSASTERLDVVQIRVDKQDGRSIVLGSESIREDPLTGDRFFHEFSDEHRLLVTFANIDVGDLLVVRTNRNVFRPRVPGGFMTAPVLDRSVAWEETNYTISVPADMPMRVDTRGFDSQKELIRDRVMYYLHAPKVAAPPKEVAVLAEFDRMPRFAVSTFRNWDDFATAYASVLLPHAKVAPAVATMAAKLTAGMTEPARQATVLYEWVRDHIRYVPLALEQSARDPHDAEQVLQNFYGDCKDHVVLLYALLAAVRIPAEIVLLNNTNASTIADAPNLRPMNHLILYLPDFNAYSDSTLAFAPGGVLPFSVLGKPCIHLGGSGLSRRDIAIPASGDTTSKMTTDLVFGADGVVTGTTTTIGRGAFGLWLRGAAKVYGNNDPGAGVAVLRQHGTPGTGTFQFDPPASRDRDYTVRGTFQLENQSALLAGGFFQLWTGLRILPRPGDVLGGPMFLRDLPKTQPTFCYPGIQSEQLSLTVPAGRSLGSIPKDIKIDGDHVHYRSHWETEGQKVTVTRDFESLLPGPTCDGPVREEMAEILDKIRADLVNPLGIRQDALSTPDAGAKK